MSATLRQEMNAIIEGIDAEIERRDRWMERAAKLLFRLSTRQSILHRSMVECIECKTVEGHAPDCELTRLLEEAKEWMGA